jgi:hypothetical protein
LEQTESGRLELTVSSDPRLLAGVSAAVSHFGELGGLDEAARAELVAAFEDCFREVFGTASQNSKPIEMSIGAPSGKIDAVLIFHGEHARPEKAEKIRMMFAGKLDTVRLETSGDSIRLSLVKNHAPARKKR